MKVIQLNIWHGKLGDLVIEFLKKERPDLVCMQEVNAVRDDATYGVFTPLQKIQEEAGFEHSFFSPVFSYHFQNRTAQFGNAILSRLPLEHQETVFVHNDYQENFDGTEHDYNIRNLQLCKVKSANGTDITLVNHHGYHIKNPQGDNQSVKAMEKVANTVLALSGPVIFCGDFNVSPDSPAMQPLQALNLRNLTAEQSIPTTLSRLHFLEHPVPCDYILVSPDVPITSFKAADQTVSDHRPLILETGER